MKDSEKTSGMASGACSCTASKKASEEEACAREVAGRLSGASVEFGRSGSVMMVPSDACPPLPVIWPSPAAFLFGAPGDASVFDLVRDELKFRAFGLESPYTGFALRNAWAAGLSGCSSAEELSIRLAVLP